MDKILDIGASFQNMRQYRTLCEPKLQVYQFNNCQKEQLEIMTMCTMYAQKRQTAVHHKRDIVQTLKKNKRHLSCSYSLITFCLVDLLAFYLFLATLAAWFYAWHCRSVHHFD